MLTKRQIEVLAILIKSKDQEIVCEGRYCMIDLENISRGTVTALIAHMAIRDAGYAGAGCEIYCPTGEAANIVKRPALADEMVSRVFSHQPFSVTSEGVVIDA